MLRIRLFGSFAATADDEPLGRPARRNVAWLWIYVLLHREVETRRDSLAFTLWPDVPESTARFNLRHSLHYLLKHLPACDEARPWILRDRKSVRWNPDADCWLDVATFETVCLRVGMRSGDTAAALKDFEQLTALYEGDLLVDLEPAWIGEARRRLRVRYVRALAALAELLESGGQPAAAIEASEQLVALDPAHEASYRRLMRLAYAAGDRSGALQWFDACRDVLRQQISVEPMVETLALRDAIAGGETPATETQTPQTRTEAVEVPATPAPPPTNLRPLLSRFVGRARELEQATTLMRGTRLLTLTGTGGTGKTRLAVELAARQLDAFADGAWWVELAGLEDGRLVVQEVASTIGLSQDGRPLSDALCEHISQRHVLIVLDNCEHVLSPAADVTRRLLQACPNVTVLATSRERLDLDGEVAWLVPPLSLPDCAHAAADADLAESDAVQLFLDRVTAAWPKFEATRDRLLAIARICCRVEGIPLAIELAAARVGVLTVLEIDQRLDDGFGLLRSRSRSKPARHATLNAAIAWSYDLLSERERALLRRLTVFVGGFSLPAAEAVCGGDADGATPELEPDEILDLLAQLIDKSLVTRDEGGRNGASRYRLLEIIRAFGAERLAEHDEAEQLRERHTNYYLTLVQHGGAETASPGDTEWLDRLDTEYSNLRVALGESLERGDKEAALRCASALHRFWYQRGHLEWERTWLEEALTAAGGAVSASVTAEAHSAAGVLSYALGDHVEAKAHYKRSADLYREQGDRAGLAASLTRIAHAAAQVADYDAARQACEEGLGIWRQIDDELGTANATIVLAHIEMHDGRYDVARSLYQRALEQYRGLPGQYLGTHNALRGLAIVSQLRCDYEAAEAFAQDWLASSRERAHKMDVATSMNQLGRLANDMGHYEAAADWVKQAFAVWRELGNDDLVARALNNLGEIELRQGRYSSARVLFEKSLAIKREHGDEWGIAFTCLGVAEVRYYEGDLGEAEAIASASLETARATGDKSMTAWALRTLARIVLAAGVPQRAAEMLRECLSAERDLGEMRSMAITLEICAALLAAEGDYEAAMRLLGATAHKRAAVGAPRTAGEAWDVGNVTSLARQHLSDEQLAAALEMGRAETLDAAVTATLDRLAGGPGS